jgi:hypothetical protein
MNDIYNKKTNSCKLPLPENVDNYISLCSNYYYVDKTLLIKEIIDDHCLLTVFNRPNGFGKTLNLDMLKVFFEKTNNDTSIYFKDKKIWSCGQEYREQQGKYPVIYVSFKDAKGNFFEEVAKKILAEFQREFKRHSELLNSKSLSIYEKEDYLRYLSSQQNPLMGDWALKDLSHLL